MDIKLERIGPETTGSIQQNKNKNNMVIWSPSVLSCRILSNIQLLDKYIVFVGPMKLELETQDAIYFIRIN
jgi:hypothetical protein